MRTKKLLTKKVTPGMTVAEDIFTEGNQMIVPQNTVLTSRIIARLKFYSIYEIVIYDVNQEGARTGPLFCSQGMDSYLNGVRSTREFKEFKKVFLVSVENVRESLDAIVRKNAPIEVGALIKEMENIIKESRNGLHLLDMLHCIRDYDDSTYVHSVNVALLCHIMGEWLQLSRRDVDLLTISGLVHDIGKLMIPKEIITKPGKLTTEEYAIIKSHTVHGYQILKDKKIDKRIKYAALMHHERCDGTGYPTGRKRKGIDVFAKIVAIADVYDAMTSNRVYRQAICPFDVIGIFEQEGIYKYEPGFLLPFLERVVQTYINNTVRLSNQQLGTVVMINKLSLSRPVVHTENVFVDLSKEPELSITSVL